MTARPENVGLGQKISTGMPWLDDVAATMEQAFEPLLGQDRRAARATSFTAPGWPLTARGSRHGAGRLLVSIDGL